MKLRVRSIQTGETLRIQLPSPSSTLHQFRQIVSETLSPSPSLSSIHFSLNRTDELQASSPHASLHSLGLTSGDLLYYSLHPQSETPDAASSHQQTPLHDSTQSVDATQQTQLHDSKQPVDVTQQTPLHHSKQPVDATQQTQLHDSKRPVDVIQQTPLHDSKQPVDATQQTLEFPGMDVDEEPVDTAAMKTSEPYFLRVLREELGSDVTAHRLLVVAVHAILLESGFVGIDMVSGTRVDKIRVPEHWPSRNSSMSVWYTLPYLLDNNSSGGLIECVVLKFQCIGDLVNVYGCLARDDVGLHKVFLSRNKFALMWDDSDKKDSYRENVVFEFWKMVKDGLALPLSIDLCERTGLNLPACLMRLPTELKVNILEVLPAVDVAKMGCVCSEMRYLASNNDLWKRKYAEEFGQASGVDTMANWKQRFAVTWEVNKKRKRANRWHPSAVRHFYFPARRDPYALWVRHIVGDDPTYGRYEPPLGWIDRPFARTRGQHNFSPICEWRL